MPKDVDSTATVDVELEHASPTHSSANTTRADAQDSETRTEQELDTITTGNVSSAPFTLLSLLHL